MDVDHAGGAADRAAAQRSGRARASCGRRRPRSPPASSRRRWRSRRSRSCSACDALTILVTGFGPFPGAPFNPTGPLVAAARARAAAGFGGRENRRARVSDQLRGGRPRSAGADRAPQAGCTADVRAGAAREDAAHRDARAQRAGAAARRRRRRARRAKSRRADHRRSLCRPRRRDSRLAARAARVPVVRSRDAGRYLCNYLCWRGTEAAAKPGGPRLAAFVHVPMIRRKARPRGGKHVSLGRRSRPRRCAAD